VTDFGLARTVADAPTTSLAGTPAFMAPEQVDACWGAVSPRTDVWGLGSILLFLLTGRPPHPGPDVATVLTNVVSGRPVALDGDERSRLPQFFDAVIRRCLAKRPEERFSSAAELADALAGLVGQSAAASSTN
jgi:serine/threonine protein kinase